MIRKGFGPVMTCDEIMGVVREPAILPGSRRPRKQSRFGRKTAIRTSEMERFPVRTISQSAAMPR